MRRQLVPGPVVRLTVIKAKTRPGIEASAGAVSMVQFAHAHLMDTPVSSLLVTLYIAHAAGY